MFPGAPAALLVVLCAGCAKKPHSSEPAGNLSTVTADASDSLRISLVAPREATSGQPVPIVIRLENPSSRPVDLYLRGRTITFDIFVTRPAGQVAWQRLKDEVIPAVIQLKTLQPKGVIELEAEWDQRDNRGNRLPPGTYSVRGTVLTDGPALETRAAPLRIGS